MSRFWVSLPWKPWDCRLTPPRGVSSPRILSFFERAATALTLAEDRNSLTIPPTGSPVLPILTGTGKTHIAAPLAPPPLKHKSGSYCHFTLQVTAAGGHFMVPPSGHFMGS